MATPSKKRRLRFSLATLLVVVTVLSLWLGRTSYLARRQTKAINAIVAADGIVIFDGGQNSSGAASGTPTVRDRLQAAIGEDYFRTVEAVDFATNRGRRKGTKEPKATDKSLALLTGVPDVTNLELGNNETVTDEVLVHLSSLRNLKTLYLYRTGVRGPGLVHIERLPLLEALSLEHTPLDDDGLVHIGGMTGLKWLYLGHTKITDAGVGRLANLKNLEMLSLKYTGITDESLVHLERLTCLNELDLTGTNVTAAGAAKIRRALPNCTVGVTFGLGQIPADVTLFPDGSQSTANDMNAKFKELSIDGHASADTSQAGSPVTKLHLEHTTLTVRPP